MLIRRRLTYHGVVVDIKHFTRSDSPERDMEKLLAEYLGRMEDKNIEELSIFMDGDFTVKYAGDYQLEYSLIDLLDTIPQIVKFHDQIDDS